MSAQDLQNLENAEFKEAFDYFDKVKTIWLVWSIPICQQNNFRPQFFWCNFINSIHLYLIKIKEKGKIYLIASQMNSWLHSIALMECRDKISKFCQQRLSSYDVYKSALEIL